MRLGRDPRVALTVPRNPTSIAFSCPGDSAGMEWWLCPRSGTTVAPGSSSVAERAVRLGWLCRLRVGSTTSTGTSSADIASGAGRVGKTMRLDGKSSAPDVSRSR